MKWYEKTWKWIKKYWGIVLSAVALAVGLDVNIEYESIVQDRKTARTRIQELEGV